jgi:hypothetical protein
MPSNQEYKGKGIKGRNYDELSGVGTSSAGKTGTTGNLNDGGRDGGVGSPDLADSGNLQSAQAGQPGGTPAQGNSVRSQSNQHNASQQSAGTQGGGLQSGQSRNPHHRQSGRGRLSEDDLDTDESGSR